MSVETQEMQSNEIRKERARTTFKVDEQIDITLIEGRSFGGLLLYYREAVFDKIYRSEELDELLVYFLKYSCLFAAIFGSVLGVFSLNMQIVSGAIKAPLLLWGTLGICMPALFTFNVLLGSKLSLKQTATVLSMSTYLMSTVLVSLAPIMLFFIISASGKNFVLLLNVIAFSVSGLFGTSLLWNAMGYLTVRSGNVYNSSIVKAWTIIYIFVGTQFAWILRPFIGNPEIFSWVRDINGNFYVGLLHIISELF